LRVAAYALAASFVLSIHVAAAERAASMLA
jgi:hypothetical protein